MVKDLPSYIIMVTNILNKSFKILNSARITNLFSPYSVIIFLYSAGHSKQLTFAPHFLTVDGGYGNWSLNSTCNVTCGQGFETWSRACNNPEPKYGGRNCSHLGKHVALKRCTAKPCPGELGLENNSSYNMKIFQLLPRYSL